jgi:glucose/arabinose dehydrogenase
MSINLFSNKTLGVLLAGLTLNCANIACVSAQNPVETNEPSADYKPAFAGQTRIAGVKTKTPLDISIINEKLENPWAISVLPNGGFLITQKQGTMVILTPDGKLSKKKPVYHQR